MNVETEIISQLQQRTARIRNVCVLAHVDHGKTTLSDHLIAANGLIHPRLAGELRYMDSKEEEQARGITMKSSSISLLFAPGAAHLPAGPNSLTRQEKLDQGHLVNLIDSPGHVDFCSEVSTAVRLSDGAIVVVDAVEGVCIQTHAVLRQAWEEKVRMCLVVNKVDRLILELRLTPGEAYERLKSIIAHVNMIVSSFQSERFISEADSVLAYEDAKASAGGQEAREAREEREEEEDGEDVFAPERGNVAFGSAHDGWAFHIPQFAQLYAAKMGCKAEALQRALWGDYAYQPKTKRIVRIKADQQGRLKPLFVQLALEPLWKAYTACDPGSDHRAILSRIVEGLGLTGVSERAVQHPEPRSALMAVLRAWLPLAEAVLQMAVDHLPSPMEAAPERLPRLLPPRGAALRGHAPSPELTSALDASEAALAACSTDPNAPVVVYVSKMVAVPASALPRLPGEAAPADPHEERFLAFGRVFSGVLREGQVVSVLPATYNPADPAAAATLRQELPVTALYLMMGRGLERLPEVPAGSVLALGGLDQAILKSATLASTPLCRPLAPMLFQSAPIVRVAVEPARPADMPALISGLRLLHRADPLVQVLVQESGEHVLCAAGEVHLETCIKDLRDRFARVELVVSAPIVAFRETVHSPGEAGDAGGARAGPRVVEATTASGACTLRVRAVPLPAALAAALDQNADLLRLTVAGQQGSLEEEAEHPAAGGSSSLAADGAADLFGDIGSVGGSGSLAAFSEKLRGAAAEAELLPLLQRAWMFGPKRVGPNLLVASPALGTGAASLWDTPAAAVVRLAKQERGRLAAAAAAAMAGKQEGYGDEGEDAAAALRHVPVRLGFPEAAQRLRLCEGGAVTAGSHAADSIAELTSHLQNATLGDGRSSAAAATGGDPASSTVEHLRYSVESGVAAGFQLAASAGPLCDEPLWGVAFEVEARFNLRRAGSGSGEGGGLAGVRAALGEDVYGPFSGQVTSTVRQALRQAVTEAGPRVVEALFLCEVATSSEGLAAVYAVLGRRRARILREEMRDGSDLFTVHAYLPAEASFGFVDELRRRSSGAASASLMLSHWERLELDPFFVPTTEEEREEFGEEGQGVGAANLAKRLIDLVRRRKGLPVEEKVVESATKQRTRARKV